MKKTLIGILLSLLTFPLSAQMNIDSLENVLATGALTTDEQLQLYVRIGEYYCQSNAEKSLYYGKKGLRLAEKENDSGLIARNCINIGAAYLLTSSPDSSLSYINRAIELSDKGRNEKTEARAYNILGIYYGLIGKQEEALESNLKSLASFEKMGDKTNAVILMINISSFYVQMNLDERSFYYLKRAQETTETMENVDPRLKTAVHELLGLHYLKSGDYDNALENSLLALDLSYANNLVRYQLTVTQHLAGIYTDGFRDYEKAEMYALECIKVAESVEATDFIIGAWNILTKVYIGSGKYEKGKEIALKAWNTDSTTVYSAISTAYNLAVCYMHLGQHEKALYYYGKQDSLRIKEAEKELQNSMADMEVKYETEKKQTRITALEKEQKMYAGLGVALAIALLSVIGLLIYRHRVAAQKKKIAEQQIIQLEQDKRIIAIQSSLKTEKAERDLIAHDLHDSVSSLLTVVKNNMSLYSASHHTDTNYYNNAFEVLSKSITELRRVVYHLKSFILTKEGLVAALDDFCRFIPNTELHFKGLNRRFDPDKEYVLYDCACELINNALKHSGASRIDVHLNMDEQSVYLSVADNGTGFDLQEIIPGIGLDNIRSNLSAFGGHLDILSEPGKGTEANVELVV